MGLRLRESQPLRGTPTVGRALSSGSRSVKLCGDRAKPENIARLLPGCDGALVFLAQSRSAFDQGRVGGGEMVLVEPHVVLKSGAGMPARRDCPFIDHSLASTNACGTPLGIGRACLQQFDIEVEDLPIERRRVFDAHHELDVEIAV